MRSLVKPVLLTIFVTVLLLAGLAALIYKTQAVDTTLSNSLHNQLRDLKQLDAELNLNVLRTKNGLNKNYDKLASQQKLAEDMRLAIDRLAEEMKQGALTVPDLTGIKSAIAGKTELIDRFKTQNSVLTNSLRFFPTAALQFQDHASQFQGPPQAVADLNDLTKTVTELVANIMRYSITPDADLNKQIGDALTKLESSAAAYPGPIGEQLSLLASHGQVIREQKTGEDKILADIANVPTAEKIDQFGAALDAEFATTLQERNQWRWILIAYSVGLLLLLVVAMYKLMQSYASLNVANQSLVQANETLESRVETRTRDLANALSHLKESEAQLVQAEKMASLGQMVAGIAHEINTPLAYIRSGLEVVKARVGDVGILVQEASELKRQMAEPDIDEEKLAGQFAKFDEITTAFEETGALKEMGQLLDDGAQGIDQISEIVLNLKNFSRLDRAKVDEFDVNDGIASTLKIVNNRLKNRTVHTDFGRVPLVRCSPSQINQVFLNLLTNACQATTEEEGKISVVTRPRGDGVQIDIVDNGKGIAAESLSKIFDPFFTTNKVGEGTGLGLSIVRKIIEEHGGEISVSSRLGVGSRFSVHLPSQLAPRVETPLADAETVADD